MGNFLLKFGTKFYPVFKFGDKKIGDRIFKSSFSQTEFRRPSTPTTGLVTTKITVRPGKKSAVRPPQTPTKVAVQPPENVIRKIIIKNLRSSWGSNKSNQGLAVTQVWSLNEWREHESNQKKKKESVWRKDIICCCWCDAQLLSAVAACHNPFCKEPLLG